MTKIEIVTSNENHELHEIIAYDVAEWCLEYFDIEDKVKKVTIDITGSSLRGAWGECSEGKQEDTYVVKINPNQILRDFIATVVHEMVHVKQWATGVWRGEGELEAKQLQYTLTDKMWQEKVI